VYKKVRTYRKRIASKPNRLEATFHCHFL